MWLSYRFSKVFITFSQRFCIEIWQDTRTENLTEVSYHFDNLLINFTLLSYCSQHTTIRKLCQILNTKALQKFRLKSHLKVSSKALSCFFERTFEFRNQWKLYVTNWYGPYFCLFYALPGKYSFVVLMSGKWLLFHLYYFRVCWWLRVYLFDQRCCSEISIWKALYRINIEIIVRRILTSKSKKTECKDNIRE